MEDENTIDYVPASDSDKEHLKEFIRVWETCPELWNTSIYAYRDKVKKNIALDMLLVIYKRIKPPSTREDVKKKLNSLRTNFRKELKKILKSKSSGKGTDEIYTPSSSWTYYELLFLTADEQPVNITNPVKKTTETDIETVQDQSNYSISSMVPPACPSLTTGSKKRKKDNDHQKLIERTVTYLEKNDDEEDIYHLAKVWANKLKKMEPMQKLFAEKAIHDIIFEAQLGKLRKNSVKYNEDVPYTSSPLPYREPLYHSKVNYIPSPSPSPNTQDSCLTYGSNPSSHSIINTFENSDITRNTQFFFKPTSKNQSIITTGVPSQIILNPTTQQFSYVTPDSVSQENTNNMTSNITISADVHAEDNSEGNNIAQFFKDFN